MLCWKRQFTRPFMSVLVLAFLVLRTVVRIILNALDESGRRRNRFRRLKINAFSYRMSTNDFVTLFRNLSDSSSLQIFSSHFLKFPLSRRLILFLLFKSTLFTECLHLSIYLPRAEFGLAFLLTCVPLSAQLWWVHWSYTVGGKLRRRGRELAIRPPKARMLRLRK